MRPAGGDKHGGLFVLLKRWRFSPLIVVSRGHFSLVTRKWSRPGCDVLAAIRPPLRNALWLIVPILAWNLIYFDELPARYADDRGLPSLLPIIEHALRLVVFGAPLWMRLPPLGEARAPYALFTLGFAIYIGSWLPWILADAPLHSRSLVLQLAPAYTPFVWLVALGWLSRWRWYQGVVCAFVMVHTYATFLRLR